MNSAGMSTNFANVTDNLEINGRETEQPGFFWNVLLKMHRNFDNTSGNDVLNSERLTEEDEFPVNYKFSKVFFLKNSDCKLMIYKSRF